MKACIIYDSRFGNTEKIARALEAGLADSGMEVTSFRPGLGALESFEESGLVCLGAPTEAFSASKAMKDFLKKAKKVAGAGKVAFAFDTRVDSRLSGSASKYIEGELSKIGVTMAAQRESAIVSVAKKSGAIAGAQLREGEEERFRAIGLRLGAGLAKEASK